MLVTSHITSILMQSTECQWEIMKISDNGSKHAASPSCMTIGLNIISANHRWNLSMLQPLSEPF